MPLYLVAVGGSGQHVALATSRLIHIRAMPSDIRCRVIDADDHSKLSVATKTYAGYASQEHRTPHPLPGAASFLVPFDVERASAAGSRDGVPFRSLFVTPTDTDDKAVFDALFPPADGNVNVLKGFYARPTVGATAFSAQGERVLDEVRNESGRADKTFVVGSLIGGTGSGVLPSLIQKAANESWFGIFLLSWLQPDGQGDNQVSVADMESNMRHGLQFYYDRIRPRLRASLLIGPPKGTGGDLVKARTPVDGETPSLFHVLAAWGILSLSTDTTSTWKNSVVAYAHDTDAERSLLDERWHGDVTLRRRIFAAKRASMWLDYYLDDRTGKALKDAFGLFGSRGSVPSGLYTGVKEAADAARVKSARMVELLLPELQHRQQGLRDTATYFDTVFNGLGRDEKLEAHEGDELGMLRQLWSVEPAVRPKGALPEANDYAADLADRLVDQLLADVK